MAPVGDMLATDWAMTSGRLSVLRRSVFAPAAAPSGDAPVAPAPCLTSDISSLLCLSVSCEVGRRGVPRPYDADPLLGWSQCSVTGTSSAGLPTKKPHGFR